MLSSEAAKEDAGKISILYRAEPRARKKNSLQIFSPKAELKHNQGKIPI
jgi:hypothetical protein